MFVSTVVAQTNGLPLTPTKKIQFTTNEATWMNVDISPDGDTLVFDLLGDLYLLPATGGTAERITSGMALDAQPRFSPDGKRITFLSDRSGSDNIYVLEVGKKITDATEVGGDTGLHAITSGGDTSYASPEWSPDGQYIVATLTPRFTWIDVNHRLWIYDMDGGSGTELLYNGEPLYALGSAFGGDSRSLYFANRGSNSNAAYGHRIEQYDLVTGQLTRVTGRVGGAIRPALSSDGKWLVYGSRHDGQTGYRLRDLETEMEKWLVFPVQRDQQENEWMGTSTDHMPGYAFTPDNDAIVASFNGRLYRVSIPDGETTEIPFEVEVEMDIGPLMHFDKRVPDGPVKARQIRWPSISPDGTQMVFTALHKLYVKDLDSGIAKRVAEMEDGQFTPAWSWDGKWIAFVTWSDYTGGQLYKVRPNGSGLERLDTVEAYYKEPAWSPDGKEIVVIKGPWQQREQKLDLVRIPASGGTAQVIAPATGSNPHFTRDPERVYFNHGSDGLVSLRMDGSDQRVHLQARGRRSALGPGGPQLASEVFMGPDGKRALVHADQNVYLVSVPPLGTEAAVVSVTQPEGAAFPVARLNTLSTHFPRWGAGGSEVTWSLGSAVFRYDLVAAAGDDHYAAAESSVDLEFARERGKGVVALTGATLLTMDTAKGTQGIVEHGTVVIEDNRIVAVGPRVKIPSGAHVVDVGGKFILPGFVDLHAHMRRESGIHRQMIWSFLENLAFGVTTTRDPQAGEIDLFTYSDLVATGEMVGPRIFTSGPGIFNDWPVYDIDDARKVARKYRDYYKVGTVKQYLAGDRRQRQLLSMALYEAELIPTTEGVDMKTMITQVFDGYSLEHVFPHFPLYKDMVQLLAQSGTYYDPTVIVSVGPRSEYYYWTRTAVHDDARVRRFMPHSLLDAQTQRVPWFHDMEFVFEDFGKTLKDVVAAGGKVGIGSHGEMQGICYHWEIWNVQSGGMTEMDALRSATIVGAEALGFSADLGSLEVGKLADLVVLSRNPLDDIHNTTSVELVMKNGLLYDAGTLDMLWPEKKQLPAPYWWDDVPSSSR